MGILKPSACLRLRPLPPSAFMSLRLVVGALMLPPILLLLLAVLAVSMLVDYLLVTNGLCIYGRAVLTQHDCHHGRQQVLITQRSILGIGVFGEGWQVPELVSDLLH
jgi:hypothetical protein